MERLAAALAAIDAANADDPNVIMLDGGERPKELAHAELMTRWVRTLDPVGQSAEPPAWAITGWPCGQGPELSGPRER